MPQAAFPKLLSSQIAFDIARTILDGFDKHYRLFRQTSQRAKRHFETGAWGVAQQAARNRIGFYDQRVQECVQALEDEHSDSELTDGVWRELKLHYIGMLSDHKQPELAESFFNSVCCNILYRTYFHNDFIFVRPVVSTEHIDTVELLPTYRVYYPHIDGLRFTLKRVVANFQLDAKFANLDGDIAQVEARLKQLFGAEELIAELMHHAPSLAEIEGGQIILRHLYIERRMVPLNIFLTKAEQAGNDALIEHGVVAYGNAMKELVATNIFPGDMLYKHFGVTRHGRVVFYDYDEIEYITDCNFRDIPQPRNEEDDMSAEPWYSVGKHDVFPEQFGAFLLGNAKIRKAFMAHHADLLSRACWQARKQRILDGYIEDVYPYPQQIRFCHLASPASAASSPTALDTPASATPPVLTIPYLENLHNE